MGTQQVCLVLSLHLKVKKKKGQRDRAGGSPRDRRDTQTSHRLIGIAHNQAESELNIIKERLTPHTHCLEYSNYANGTFINGQH